MGVDFANTRRNAQPPKSQLAKKSTCQKVNLPKKVNSFKTPTIAFWLFYAQVDFLASWLFGQLTFCRLTISPSIDFASFQNCQLLFCTLKTYLVCVLNGWIDANRINDIEFQIQLNHRYKITTQELGTWKVTRVSFGLNHKHWTRLERLARAKHLLITKIRKLQP